jgi:membrane fusion protein, multidrug efflux system
VPMTIKAKSNDPMRGAAPKASRITSIPGAFGAVIFTLLWWAANALANEPAEPIRGIVRALDHAAIATELTTQKVSDVRVRDGMPFAKGATLLTFDCRRLEAEASVAEAQKREAQLAFESNQQLEKRQAIGRFDVDISAARLARAKAEVSVHAARLANCTIIAPFDGRVAEVGVRAHEFPSAGKPLLTVVGTERIEIEFLFPSRLFDRLKPGQRLTYAIDELNRTFDVEIERIGAAIDPVSQLVKAFAKFVELPPDVLPGMSGTAKGINADPSPSGRKAL